LPDAEFGGEVVSRNQKDSRCGIADRALDGWVPLRTRINLTVLPNRDRESSLFKGV
jgi:hypothetical protein